MQKNGFIKCILMNLYKLSLKKEETLFFQNNNYMEFFKEQRLTCKNNILIPGSGVNLSEYSLEDYPKENGVISFLFIGRLMVDKGVSELVQAARIIKNKYDNILFDLVGFCEEEYKKNCRK